MMVLLQLTYLGILSILYAIMMMLTWILFIFYTIVKMVVLLQLA